MADSILIFSICLISAMVFFATNIDISVLFNRKLETEYVDVDILQQYHAYLLKYNKSYQHEEILSRFQYFKKSLKGIHLLNSIHPDSVFGLNKFSDWSRNEFRRRMLSPIIGRCKPLKRDRCPPNLRVTGLLRSDSSQYTARYKLPDYVDWREKGRVSAVLNQKQCHGCWALSIVGVMESMAVNTTGKLTRLSAQELMDCSVVNRGCERGDILEALNFLCTQDYPIVREEEYPLRLIDEDCRVHSQRGIRIKNFNNVCDMRTDEMLKVIALHGPVVVAVNAEPWYYYNSGIIQQACGGEWEQLNHVVQIVGYNLRGEVPYYIVRNSWGEDFGDNGYLKLAVDGNVCGLSRNVAYFDVKD